LLWVVVWLGLSVRKEWLIAPTPFDD